MSHEDELARLRAEFDQARQVTKELARSAWSFYRELTYQGFGRSQAMTLTDTWLNGVIHSAGGGEES